MQPCEDVRERLLQSEGDRHTADASGREDGRDGDAVVLEDDEDAHDVDDADEDVVEQRGLREILVRPLKVHGDDAVHRTRKDARDGDDVAREEQIGQQLRQGRRDLDGLDRPVEADDEAEEDRYAVHGADKDVFPCALIDRKMMVDVAADETVGDDADGECAEDDARRDEKELDDRLDVKGLQKCKQEGLLS